MLCRRRLYRVRAAERRDLHLLPAVERAATSRYGAALAKVYASLCMTAEQLEGRQHRGRLWVAVDRRDRPVGFATWSTLDGLAHLDEIDVHPAHGRRGLGSRLLAAAYAWALDRGREGMTLSTSAGVPWTLPFYQGHGFRVLAEPAYTDGLRRLRAAEAAAGLPMTLRLIMHRRM